MRILSTAIAAAVVAGAAALSPSAHADAYRASIDACESAISTRLGMANVPARYDIEKVKTRARYRDLDFTVSAYDEASPVQGVRVACRSTSSGRVLALEFEDESRVQALATQ